MRYVIHDKLVDGRVRIGAMASDSTYGLAGCFNVIAPNGRRLHIMSSGASDGTGWEHVSVSLPNRPPNWQEMSFVCDLFWGPEECVIQYRPPESRYVNNHPNCLHWWKWVGGEFPMPPIELVGIK